MLWWFLPFATVTRSWQARDMIVTGSWQARETAMVAHLWSALGSQLTDPSHGDQFLLVSRGRGNMVRAAILKNNGSLNKIIATSWHLLRFLFAWCLRPINSAFRQKICLWRIFNLLKWVIFQFETSIISNYKSKIPYLSNCQSARFLNFRHQCPLTMHDLTQSSSLDMASCIW